MDAKGRALSETHGGLSFRAKVPVLKIYNSVSVVGVAQLVEPRIVIPVVVGSSPIVHPTIILDSAVGIYCE